MKTLILLAVAAMTMSAAMAQVTVQGNKFYDNISVTLKGGMVSPYQHYAAALSYASRLPQYGAWA